MKSYDEAAIKAIANPRDVANFIGMETRGSGRYIFVRCPMHEKTIGKTDSKIGNCILTKRGFHCFACGAYGDIFDMVTAYTGCTYPEALKTIGNMYGGADAFVEEGGQTRKKTIHTLSAEDLALIGMSHTYIPEKSDEGRLLYNVSAQKEEETAKTGCLRKGNEYLLYQKGERINLRVLQDRDPQGYYSLIERKAREAANKYRFARKDCDSKNTRVYQDLLILFQQTDELPADILEGMKKAFTKKQKRAEAIRDEYRKLKEQNQN